MGFMLLPKGIDSSNPSKCIDNIGEQKIPLKIGTHIVGREKFLHCDDKRLSRQHAKLEVQDDLVTFTGLHKNPCFYILKGGKLQKLEQTKGVDLKTGDMFGLLPNKCWYEIIHVSDDIQAQEPMPEQNQESAVQNDDSNKTTMVDSSEENSIGNQSQSLLQDLPSTFIDPVNNEGNNEEQATTPVKVKTERLDAADPSPLKRSIQDSEVKTEPDDDGAKKVKTEPGEALPGASTGKNGAEDVSDAAPSGVSPPSVAPPAAASSSVDRAGPACASPPQLRERCMYGANCYRKNPVHKAEFSHPSDADWGAGARGVCPYGARCQRRRAAHWRDHSHPPGTAPPAHRQPQHGPQGKRQRRKKERDSTGTDSEEDSPDDVILTGKRARKTRDVQTWSESGSEEEDPFGTDEEDEWKPTDSQYTQDTQDD